MISLFGRIQRLKLPLQKIPNVIIIIRLILGPQIQPQQQKSVNIIGILEAQERTLKRLLQLQIKSNIPALVKRLLNS